MLFPFPKGHSRKRIPVAFSHSVGILFALSSCCPMYMLGLGLAHMACVAYSVSDSTDYYFIYCTEITAVKLNV